MAFDISALNAYVNENAGELISKTLFVDGVLNDVTIMSGVKGPTNINLFDTDAVLQLGTTCAWEPDGTTALSVRTITPKTLKVQESLCNKDLKATYQVENLRPGANDTSIPFEEMYINTKIAKIQQSINNIAWNGSTGDTHTVAGWLELMEADSDVVNVTGATFSAANIVAEVDSLIDSLDENLMAEDDLKIYMSLTHFNTLYKALRDANLFHFDVITASKERRFMYPSAINVEVIAVKELAGAGKIVLTSEKNLVRSVDLESDEDEMYSTIDDRTRTLDFQAFFTIGFNYAYGQYISVLKA